jgi:hypothetical protein
MTFGDYKDMDIRYKYVIYCHYVAVSECIFTVM